MRPWIKSGCGLGRCGHGTVRGLLAHVVTAVDADRRACRGRSPVGCGTAQARCRCPCANAAWRIANPAAGRRRRAVYLGQITESRRVTNARILDRIPQPAAFFAAGLDGALAGTALCAIDAGCAIAECVATSASHRRRGAARSVMQALETWAAARGCDILCLQVVETNAPALALYSGLSFVLVARNRFWVTENR